MAPKRRAGSRKALDTPARLLEILGTIDRPPTVCSFGDQPIPLPGLDVDGVGSIGLPLGKAQAQELIAQCRQAPYGQGTETLVDTDVRRVWELDATQFELANPKWPTFVESLVADIRNDLGLSDLKLQAHLYKLLVYDKGSFFLPHRDGEKLDGMVATLVIALPSVHRGGELIVSHESQSQTIEMKGAASGLECSYAAFYADCEHEVRPVTSGYRLCLTYNVTLNKSRRKRGVTAPSYATATTQIVDALQDWTASARTARCQEMADDSSQADGTRLAVTLAHDYTPDGLSIDHLKGADRSTVDVLFDAARQADCVAHLGLITLYQQGSAEGGYDEYNYGYGRHRRYSDFDDDDTDSEHTMGEPIGRMTSQSILSCATASRRAIIPPPGYRESTTSWPLARQRRTRVNR